MINMHQAVIYLFCGFAIMAMEYNTLESYILSKKESHKEFPFGPGAAVFKVHGKMFALVARTEKPLRTTLKCEPDDADVLRSLFDTVEPGYPMNKSHWNTVTLDGTFPDGIILDMIDSSYALSANWNRKVLVKASDKIPKSFHAEINR